MVENNMDENLLLDKSVLEEMNIQRRTLDNGAEYYIHIPENYDMITPTIVHTYGTGGMDDTRQRSIKASANSDAIWIFPFSKIEGYSAEGDDWSQIMNKVVEDSKENLNIPITNYISSSHSGGCPMSIIGSAEHIDANNINETQVMVNLDGYYEICRLTPETKETLKENDTIIFAFCQPGYQKNRYRTMGLQGLNMVIIEEFDTTHYYSKEYRHGTENMNFFTKEDRIKYVSRKGELLDTEYGYRTKIYKDGECIFDNSAYPHDIEAVNTLDKYMLCLG